MTEKITDDFRSPLCNWAGDYHGDSSSVADGSGTSGIRYGSGIAECSGDYSFGEMVQGKRTRFREWPEHHFVTTGIVCCFELSHLGEERLRQLADAISDCFRICRSLCGWRNRLLGAGSKGGGEISAG